MSRPVDWSPLAGNDPVRGDPDRVEQVGRHYRQVAHAIETAAKKLREIAEHPDMRSDAVDEFRKTANEVADKISKAHERYDGVGAALIEYAQPLREAQALSLQALGEAKDAEAAQLSANRAVDSAARAVSTVPVGADTSDARSAHARALGAADAAGQALAVAFDKVERARANRDAAADRAKARVEDVKDSGGLNDGWRDDLAGVVKSIVKIADIVAVVCGLLALLVGWIPVIGQALAAILGTIALIAAIISLLGNLYLKSTGYADWSDVAWSALGVAAFGVGRIASAGFRSASGGVRGGSRLAAGRLAAQSSSARAAQGLPTGGSMSAIRSMLGTGSPISRNAARTMVSDAAAYRNTAGSVYQNFRSIPSEFGSRLSTLSNPANWSAAMHQAPGELATMVGNFRNMEFGQLGMRVLGEGGAADDLARANQLPGAIRGSDDVAPHLSNMNRWKGEHLAAGGYSMFDTVRQGNELTGPSPAENLKIPTGAQP